MLLVCKLLCSLYGTEGAQTSTNAEPTYPLDNIAIANILSEMDFLTL